MPRYATKLAIVRSDTANIVSRQCHVIASDQSSPRTGNISKYICLIGQAV